MSIEEERTRNLKGYELELAKAEEQFKRKTEVSFRHKGNLEVLHNELNEKQQDIEKYRTRINAMY